MRSYWIHVSLVVSLAGCGSGSPENTGGDGGMDATKHDGASSGQDASPADTGSDAAADVGVADAGQDAPADAGHDAAGDAGHGDAGHGDAGHPGDAADDVVKRDPCGTVLDGGGEVFGTCEHGDKCCPGGTPDSYYCHDGGGKCPALP